MLSTFSIYDAKSGLFSTPQYCVNQAVAIRQFVEICSNPETLLFKNPEDFFLYFLGTFDEETGQTQQPETPEQIMHARGPASEAKLSIVKEQLQATTIEEAPASAYVRTESN